MTSTHYDHMIEIIAPAGTEHTVGIRILHRRTRRGRTVLGLEHCGLVPECFAVDRIPITHEETGTLSVLEALESCRLVHAAV